jgi:hypothetical protein
MNTMTCRQLGAVNDMRLALCGGTIIIVIGNRGKLP